MFGDLKFWNVRFWNKKRFYVFVLVIAAVLLQLVVRDSLQDDEKIVEAFHTSDSQPLSGLLKVQGEYPTVLLAAADKKDVLLFMAKELKISAYELSKDGASLSSKNENASAQISLKTQDKGTLIVTEIELKKIDAMTMLKEQVSQLYDRLSMTPTSFMSIRGVFHGKMNITQLNQMKDRVFSCLECETKYAQKYSGGYEYYGYTARLKESRWMNKQRMNVQLQFEYDANQDETIMNLAVPFFPQE